MYQTQALTCTFDGHENETIVSFCVNLQCKEKPQSCVNCLFTKHLDHKDDCKTMKKIREIIQENIIFIEEWIQKTEEEHNNNIQKIHNDIVKLLDCEKGQMIEFEKKLQQPHTYLYHRDFQQLRKWIDVFLQLQTNPESHFQNALEDLIILEEAILSFEKTRQQYIIDYFPDDMEEQYHQMQKYQRFLSNLIFIQCNNKDCYLNIQCCKTCKIDNEVNIFTQIKRIIQGLLSQINAWISTEKKIFEDNQRIYQFVKEFLNKKLQKIKDKNMRFENQEFRFFLQDFEGLKECLIIKQALFYNNTNVYQCNYIAGYLLILGNLYKTLLNSQNNNQQTYVLINLNRLADGLKQVDKFYFIQILEVSLSNRNIFEEAIQQFNREINPNYLGRFFIKEIIQLKCTVIRKLFFAMIRRLKLIQIFFKPLTTKDIFQLK